MTVPTEIPIIPDKVTYKKVLTQPHFWENYVRAIIGHLHLLSGPYRIRIPLSGTQPVFIVDNKYVVKLFCNLKKGYETYVNEICMYRAFTKYDWPYAPSLIATGTLKEVILRANGVDPGEIVISDTTSPSEWVWPYMVMTIMEGSPLKQLRSDFVKENEVEMLHLLSEMVRSLHRLEIPPELASEFAANPRTTPEFYPRWVQHEINSALRKQTKWATLPQHLIDELGSYLPSSSSALCNPIVPGMKPSLLHGDIHETNVFANWRRSSSHDLEVNLTGLIDFGDAQLGDPFYDLVLIHMGCFRCNKSLLRKFLDHYGLVIEDTTAFAYRMMCLTLIAPFNRLKTSSEGYQINFDEITSLHELATRLWDISEPDYKVSLDVCAAMSAKESLR